MPVPFPLRRDGILGSVTNRPFPDFVIPGAMKAGTTTMSEYLATLPQISFSVPKEPTLLMRHDYEQMPADLLVPPADAFEDVYLNCFRHARPNTLWGEGSTGYFADPTSPRLLAARNRNIKAIFLLRDPVDRTQSSFLYSRSTYREPAPTLDQAIREELSGMRDSYVPTLRHLYYSCYTTHLDNWRRHIGTEQMLLLEFEHFIRDPLEVLRRVCAFLRVEAPLNLPLVPANRTVSNGSRFNDAVMRLLYTSNPIKGALKPFLRPKFRSRLKHQVQDHLADRSGPSRAPTSPYAQAAMDERFRDMRSTLRARFAFEPRYWTSG